MHADMQAAATIPPPPPSNPNATPVVSRLPAAMSGPVRARRRRFTRFQQASAYLKGTALVVQTPTTVLATLDVHQVFHYPNGRILVRSDSPPGTLELRINENSPAWLSALRAASARRGLVLADFMVVAPIGKGGGGTVFLVREKGPDAHRPLAMKVVQKHDAFYTDGSLRHALDERVVLELVRGFPFVITLRHAFQTETALYMVSDFCSGGNLRTLLKKKSHSRMTEEDAKPIMVQIILALEYLHQINVIYRDLKPENILFTANGDVRLCDFGLSKVLSTGRFGRTKSFCGSTSYMSPQIVTGKSYGIATDLWSLGALFYRMLVGRGPFDQPTHELGSRNDPSDIQRRIQLDQLEIPSFLSLAAREMLEGLLRKSEEERTNLQDLKEALFFKNVNWDAVLQEGYDRASSSGNVTSDSELDNFDSKRLESHGIALNDKELKKTKKVNYDLDNEPKNGKKGFIKRRVSTFASSLAARRPSQMGRQQSMTSIVGFGFVSADDTSLSPSESETSGTLHESHNGIAFSRKGMR